MPQETPKSGDPKECILKCIEGTHFYDFPTEDIFRNLWLYKLGLEHLDQPAWVCDKHFSRNMIISSTGKLIELAVPDVNLPETCTKKNVIYDQLIKKITATKSPDRELVAKKLTSAADDTESSYTIPTHVENLEPTDSLLVSNAPIFSNAATGLTTTSIMVTKKMLPNTTASSTNVITVPVSTETASTATNESSLTYYTTSVPINSWLDDSSNLLMDYQLRFQGKHMCDVIEMPEYVIVFTVFKAKELKGKENVNSHVDIPSSVEVSGPVPNIEADTIEINEDNECVDNHSIAAETEEQPEIDYVYYMTKEANPRREREIQVDIPNSTRETAIQCDVALDNDMVQMTHNPQFYRKDSHLHTAPTSRHECLICGEIVGNVLSIQKHASKHRKIQSLCSHCGQVFLNELKLKAHERHVHGLDNELEIKKALRCPKLRCNKAFHSRKQLNNHIDQHLRYAEHKCTKCLRLFPSALKLHCHQHAYRNCLRQRSAKTRRWNKRK